MDLRINYNDTYYDVKIKKEGDKYKITIADQTYCVDTIFIKDNLLSLLINGKSYEAFVNKAPDGYYDLHFYNDFFRLLIQDSRIQSKGTAKKDLDVISKKVIAPMAGKVLKLTVNKGDIVKAGDVLVVIEAMKMQNEIKSPKDNIISEVLVKAGDNVSPQQPLIILGDL